MCRPHAYRDMTLSGNTGRRVTGYCVSVITFSAFLNIPRFLEMQLVSLAAKAELYISCPGFKCLHDNPYLRSLEELTQFLIVYHYFNFQVVLLIFLECNCLIKQVHTYLRCIKIFSASGNRADSEHGDRRDQKCDNLRINGSKNESVLHVVSWPFISLNLSVCTAIRV